MKLQCKYLISSFIIVACCLLQQCCLGQSTTVRPYKFGFTIDEQQHRSEQRDERGIVMGEFGFITADGIYHVTVYATDEQGRFRILAMKNYPYESPPKTVEVMVKPKIPPKTTTTAKPLPRHNFNNEACSGCFLTNGNNKPKGLNGIEDKTVKNDIRPLSKTLTSSSSAANPKLPPTATQENILTKTPKEKSSERPVESQANTSPNIDLQNSLEPPLNTQLQGNILQNLPAATHTAQPATVNQNSGKSSVQNLPNTRLNTRYTSTPTTGQKTIQTPTTTNILQTTYTTIKPITSKDTNQKRPKPTQGSSSSVSTATKTATGNPPPIMDIIMQKVLPALMGNKGQQPSSAPTTTLNSKPNVVTTGKKPSATTSGTTANRKTGGNSGSTSLNGDGDLYRFKYILDYHGHSETGKRNGNKEGSYFSIGDDDVERTIEYVANEFGYQPRIRWRKLDPNEIKSKENTLKDYEFVWFNL